MHATELCEGIRMKQETPHTLDALCSQLSTLSMQCESCIDNALDAMQVRSLRMCVCMHVSCHSMQSESCILNALKAIIVIFVPGIYL